MARRGSSVVSYEKALMKHGALNETPLAICIFLNNLRASYYPFCSFLVNSCNLLSS